MHLFSKKGRKPKPKTIKIKIENLFLNAATSIHP
jgi:hypothetical protein